MKKFQSFAVFLVLAGILTSVACKNRNEEVINGVIYAKNALNAAGSNPFSQASYQAFIAGGKTPVDYVKSTMPKDEPVFESWEYGKPTKPWTIVIRPSTSPNEYYIEGYGADIKKPIKVEHVVVNVPPPEE
ncbi:MAG TPA: hypothetical protein VLH08_01045 [Acidobacteriota bacterium]|jgi:hypothetical protein|nr:hypothetical protein [Acidobacteriota bacterium]